MALVRDTFDFIEPHLVIEAVTSDPDDDRILEAAVASNAQYIVSGDKHLLKLGQWEEIPIVTAGKKGVKRKMLISPSSFT